MSLFLFLCLLISISAAVKMCSDGTNDALTASRRLAMIEILEFFVSFFFFIKQYVFFYIFYFFIRRSGCRNWIRNSERDSNVWISHGIFGLNFVSFFFLNLI